MEVLGFDGMLYFRPNWHQDFSKPSCKFLRGSIPELKVLYDISAETIWVFPKIVVPPNHSFLIGCSIINHPFWGTRIFGNILIYAFMRLFGFAMCLHEYLKQNTDNKLFSALDDMHRISMQ